MDQQKANPIGYYKNMQAYLLKEVNQQSAANADILPALDTGYEQISKPIDLAKRKSTN